MEEEVKNIYSYPLMGFKPRAKYAPVVISILKVLEENKEPISIQSALDILEDTSKIILLIKTI